VDFHAALPVLVEVPVRDDVVVLDRLEDLVSRRATVTEDLMVVADGCILERRRMRTISTTGKSQQQVWANWSVVDVGLRWC
jgi:hypothetical protein